jgi:hypothetical protein
VSGAVVRRLDKWTGGCEREPVQNERYWP